MARTRQIPGSAPTPVSGAQEATRQSGAGGRLLVIGTPIGNLGDLSPRAREALMRADVIAAEDTRRTAQLLAALGASAPPLRSLHSHNESARLAELLALLHAGRVVALVSDAGTPLLSDPGFELVRAAAAAGLEVCAIPGPSALTAALSIAGLPAARFVFEGFLPARGGARRALLSSLATETRTLVFFEAPHRIGETLTDLVALWGADRPAAIARELTKIHETVHRGTLGELSRRAQLEPNLGRGELTLVIGGAPAMQGDTALLARALPLLLAELPPARAAAIAAQLSGVGRADAYALAQRLRPGQDG